MVRQRHSKHSKEQTATTTTSPSSTAPPPADMTAGFDNGPTTGIASWNVRSQWIFFAVASGACAAFNGVFAKLTTTELTTQLSTAVADALGLSSYEKVVEIAVRGLFFALNLIFNGVMWSLFTTALARGTSTTQVSIMNTSTNFMLTAFLGFVIFSESLPPMWWAGAALLVAGNVIIGRKDETKAAESGEYDALAQEEQGHHPEEEEGVARPKDGEVDEDEDIIDLGNLNDARRR